MLVRCTSCQRKLKIPDSMAGRKIRCPACGHVLLAQSADMAISEAVVGAGTSELPQPDEATMDEPEGEVPGGDQWSLQMADGQFYGPATKEELDTWVQEGRVPPDARVQTPEGNWHPVTEFYPQLPNEPPIAAPDDAGQQHVELQTDSPKTSDLPPGDSPAADSPAAQASVEPSPAESPSSDAKGEFGETAISPGGEQTFQPRNYPMMMTIRKVFRALALVVAISLGLNVLASFIAAIAAFLGGYATALQAINAFVLFFVNVIAHLMFIAAFLYIAETIKIILDIQKNTQETAFYVRQQMSDD
jgi:DNA-directed RNA polymerase subunit RPC12/RpoP